MMQRTSHSLLPIFVQRLPTPPPSLLRMHPCLLWPMSLLPFVHIPQSSWNPPPTDSPNINLGIMLLTLNRMPSSLIVVSISSLPSKNRPSTRILMTTSNTVIFLLPGSSQPLLSLKLPTTNLVLLGSATCQTA